jgi:hypothetical protein
MALFENISYGNNTAVGYHAGDNYTFANGTFLGANAYPTANSITNCMALGFDAHVGISNKVRIGNASVTVIEGQVDWSFPSDRRFKSSVRDEVKGLEFILKLQPVVYTFDTRKYTEFLIQNMPESMRQEYLNACDFSESSAIRHSGFVAQEVAEAAAASGYDFDGVHVPATDMDNYSISHGQFVVPLVKAIQEQQAMIEEQQRSIEELKEELRLLKGSKQW